MRTITFIYYNILLCNGNVKLHFETIRMHSLLYVRSAIWMRVRSLKWISILNNIFNTQRYLFVRILNRQYGGNKAMTMCSRIGLGTRLSFKIQVSIFHPLVLLLMQFVYIFSCIQRCWWDRTGIIPMLYALCHCNKTSSLTYVRQ